MRRAPWRLTRWRGGPGPNVSDRPITDNRPLHHGRVFDRVGQCVAKRPMRKQHLDLLALAARGDPLFFLRQCPSQIASAFVDEAGHPACRQDGGASRLEGTAAAALLPGSVANQAVLVGLLAPRDEVAIARPQALAGRADIAVIFVIEGEVAALERAIVPGGLVDDRHVRLPVGLGLDQAGVDSKAVATDQAPPRCSTARWLRTTGGTDRSRESGLGGSSRRSRDPARPDLMRKLDKKAQRPKDASAFSRGARPARGLRR